MIYHCDVLGVGCFTFPLAQIRYGKIHGNTVNVFALVDSILRGILAEGAIALSVTLSGGALFAS